MAIPSYGETTYLVLPKAIPLASLSNPVGYGWRQILLYLSADVHPDMADREGTD